MLLLSLLVAGLGPARLSAQTCGWAEKIAGGGHALLPIGEGVIVATSTQLAHFDSSGHRLWQSTTTVGALADGGSQRFWAGGRFRDSLNLPDTTLYDTSGTADQGVLYTALLDAAGQLQRWEQWPYADTLGSLGADLQAMVCQAGRCYWGGTFRDTLHLGPDTLVAQRDSAQNLARDAFLAAMDTSGAILWARRWGGPKRDRLQALSYANGRVYAAGAFQDSMQIGADTLYASGSQAIPTGTYQDVYLSCWDTSGQPLWTRTGGGSLQTLCKADEARAVMALPAGRVLLAGAAEPNPEFGPGPLLLPANGHPCGQQAFVACYDTTGQIQWLRGGGGTDSAEVNGIYSFARADSTHAWAAGRLAGDTIFFWGDTLYGSSASAQALLLRLDTAGQRSTTRRYGGPATDLATAAAPAPERGLYLSGVFNDTLRLGTRRLAAPGANAGFLARLPDSLQVVDFALPDVVSFACGDSLQLSLLPDSNITYRWQPAAGLDDTAAAAPTFQPKRTRTYTFKGAAYGCTVRDTMQLVVFPISLPLDFEASPTTLTTPPFEVNMTNLTPMASQYDFVWRFGDGDTATGLAAQHTYTDAGRYDVQLIGIEPGTGCADTLTREALIDVNPTTGRPAAPDAAGAWTYGPNPTRGQLWVHHPYEAGATAAVLTPGGKRVLQRHLAPGRSALSLKHLPAGVYVLQLSARESPVRTNHRFMLVR